jgi:metallo-beta-lactamase family protein
MKIQFLGATKQVTGSRCLLEAGGLRLLIDCGMFQERAHLARNWEPSPIPPDSIDYVLLTHAHLDHSGLLPKLVSEGFSRTILTTAATVDLAEIILKDAARIQVEDAAYKRRRHKREGRKGRYPVVPLYKTVDAQAAIALFEKAPYDTPIPLNDQVTVTYHDAGHIVGSAMLEVAVRSNGQTRTLVFSGDIGQWDKPIIRDPSVFERADYVIMESTYGDRDHDEVRAVEEQLCEVINSTVDAGGNVLIPTFAVERAQELMYHIGKLLREGRIPHLLAFLDSPMAVDVTKVFRRHRECMDEEARDLLDSRKPLFRFPGLKLVRQTRESKAINSIRGSCIIMAGSGMCTAGRIKHHLVRNVSRPESTLVFVGYQAGGTLGRRLVDGEPVVRILGTHHEVRARIAQIHGFSAHADRTGLLRWLGHLKRPPRRVFLIHGEQDSVSRLAEEIRTKWSWAVDVPDYQDEYELT